MPKSETPKDRAKTVKKTTSSHFPSKPYMRALHAQSHASVPTAAWSTIDDELLLRTKSLGKKWVEISPLFPGKTSNACRKRHARLVTHAQVEWDEFKERDLAVEFVNAKVGFFKMIAGNLKLEWRQVEKKCLELGFKTLLEKGKRVPIPFPPLDFQQGDVIPEGTQSASSPQAKLEPSLSSSPTLFKIKVGPDSESSESDDESDDGNGNGDGDCDGNGDHIPQVRSLIHQGGSVITKEELVIDKDKGGDISQNEGGELDGGGRIPPKVPPNGGCPIDGSVP